MPALIAARRLFTLSKGVGASVVVDGVTYTRIRFGDSYLDQLISSQPLYGIAA